MKININKKDFEKFKELIDAKDINLSVADMLNELYDNGFYIEEENIEKGKENDEVYEEMMDYFQIDLEDTENQILGEKFFKNPLNFLDITKYSENPYNKNINVEEVKQGSLELKYLSYNPYQLFSLNDINVDPLKFEETSPIGYFDKEYRYLALLDKDVIWMSISPNEIETMSKMVEEGKGNVLVLGLGLGYLPYMLSLKEEVKSITIIENNRDVIKLFTENILPHFEFKNKIKILYKDAFIYLKEDANKEKFDYAFVDIWHNANEALPLYLRFLPYEAKYPNTKFEYWLGKSVIALVRRCLQTLLYEEIYHLGMDYTKHENFEDILINKMHDKLRYVEINSYDDIHHILEDDNIVKLLKSLQF
ncbi:MAG: hypothetical protein LUD22_02955 [Coprobacillus sp.]|nr:hypothetical protein [Coprobacillus sp.]